MSAKLTESEIAAAYRDRDRSKSDREKACTQLTEEFGFPGDSENLELLTRLVVVPVRVGKYPITADSPVQLASWVRDPGLPGGSLFPTYTDYIRQGARRGASALWTEGGPEIRTYSDGSVAQRSRIPLRGYLAEEELLVHIGYQLRLAAAHAIVRAGTFGQALVRWQLRNHCDIRLGEYLDGQHIEIGKLPSESLVLATIIDLESTYGGDRSACHAACSLMHEFYQEHFSRPVCKLMTAEGKFSLHNFAMPQAYSLRFEWDGNQAVAYDINDDQFGRIEPNPTSGFTMRMGDYSSNAATRDEAENRLTQWSKQRNMGR